MSVAPAAAPVFRRRLPPPRIGNTLYELLACVDPPPLPSWGCEQASAFLRSEADQLALFSRRRLHRLLRLLAVSCASAGRLARLVSRPLPSSVRRRPPSPCVPPAHSLCSKLPKNGVGARVAPITWAVNNKPNSFYTITEAKLHWVPKLTRKGYPLVLVDGKVVPADEKYSAVQYEKSRLERDELERATRAGEELDADEDGDGPARPLTDNEKHEQDRKAGLLKPKGQAWGWGLWEGAFLA